MVVVTLADIPPVPTGLSFKLSKLDTIVQPHLFMITPRHVAEASDNWGGMLGLEAIKAAERKGHGCGMKGCQLRYDQHESILTLFIEVPQNRNLNAVAGLHAYLLAIKDGCEKMGIGGFAFPSV